MATNTIPRDDNQVPFQNIDSFGVVVKVPTAAFTGGTANTRGNDGGTLDPLPLFTVTGDVLVRIYGVVTVALTNATATVSVGVTDNVAGLLPVTTGTDMVANEIWNDATPTEVGVGLLSNVLGPYLVVNGLDINEYVATADVTAGDIYYVCLWRPMSRDGLVTAA